MATRVAAVAEVTGTEQMERRLVELVEQVEREKEKTRDTFQQLHSLLVVREGALIRELDGVVVEARQELKEAQRKNLQTIGDRIREELSKSLSVTWVEGAVNS